MPNLKEGKLYVVPTPIGNLKDITLRALDVLKDVDIIAAEDTRQTLKLLNHFNIKKTLISYHKFNEEDKSINIIKDLKEGKNIALVSDAGMPGISDPGHVLIKKCIEDQIKFEVLPGATAFTTALVYSGMDTTKFIFKGFIPRENKNRQKLVQEIKDRMETLIFYESPHRLKECLNFLRDSLGNRNIAICREITKIHEEIIRDSLEEVIKYYENQQPKGEYVLVLEGKSMEEIEKEKEMEWSSMNIQDHIKKYINEGYSKKESIKLVAKDRKVTKSEIYKYSIDI
ncbi:16S rRNA (cytidine(1402)-2'-O)-methyltransferase [Clostridium sp. FAM 1755]|uniref:Ribosomal RNA small subunit methyltransferase I n=2 Tax=Clostridium TaxID=1485 RepID=A0A6M0T355_CLOBO|nr:16S rRNA (cytidine(1402)-2'-O)-methyltransferase [Clostridium sporogenes]EJP6474021.1 16S rRNA (cytidine(1402)-2'-O)-methyltransferase [Clostridium botulinum]MDS1003237.1 16S rRNA (cytidine(1402)-2'-O)-methyltransferase [Clostridium sporogenes]NFA60591.1 16S rRNA (cytidine(1402)-2'-O)-methyltransferase [Clostridium botulinum]NFI74239.1 16S rRNA (cytidine(1402)-2'-O)-methyltransferase [Clostridium sporogenes]NFL73696.1 16S rRNA (cytidine(1402)-2'-O)-methyltransferase [Clostridium sporogenes]